MELSATLMLSGLRTEQPCGIRPPTQHRSVFAHLMSVMSYNEDFSEYIKAALDVHGLPQDPKMTWAKWIHAVYRNRVSPNNEELRDEAIHHVLIHHLFDAKSDILAKFDPSRLPEKIQQRPLAEQVSSYLKTCLIYMIGDAIKYLKDTYPEQEFASGLTTEDADSPSVLNKVQHGVVDPEEEELTHSTEAQKLRLAFSVWCDKKLRSASAKNIKRFFSLIMTFEGSQKELLEEFAHTTGISVSRAKQCLYIDLPKYLRAFSTSPEGKDFNLAKRIRIKLEKDKNKSEQTPALDEAPANH